MLVQVVHFGVDKKINYFSSYLINFEQTDFDHFDGTLVKYDNKLLALGDEMTKVEQMGALRKWTLHPMSLMYNFREFGYPASELSGFTAISLETSLFIFGQFLFL